SMLVRRMHEKVAGEQWRLQRDPPAVFPSTTELVKRQIMLNLPDCQMLGHLFLMAWAGVHRVPVALDIELPDGLARADIVIECLRQGFAIPSTEVVFPHRKQCNCELRVDGCLPVAKQVHADLATSYKPELLWVNYRKDMTLSLEEPHYT